MARKITAKSLWASLGNSSLCRWLFSKIICFKAPYFSTIKPKILNLDKNICIGSFKQRRAVQNHIGSIHAVAMCNLAELCGGLMVDVSLPEDMRWIPKEMNVSYLKKAYGALFATATPLDDLKSSDEGYDAKANVSIKNSEGVEVFVAVINMWVCKKAK